jgi:hypothetical protein
MQLYPHWLDGEFVRLAAEEGGQARALGEAMRAVKLHALLGTRFLLNDVQIFDSLAVLQLFADHGFREFVKQDTDFLDLRVALDPRLGDHPYALAARGFSRTQAPSWSSSVFPNDPTPIKRLADEILNEVQGPQKSINLALPSKTERAYPEHEKLLNAARHAVKYFAVCDTPQRMIVLPNPRANYYEVLKELAARQGVAEEDRRGVQEALAFIDDPKVIEDPDARKARARVLAVLDRAPREARARIWNNVVQAWNYATQVTLRPEGGSVGALRGAVSPARYFDKQTDDLVPMTADLPPPFLAMAHPAHLPCDLDAITWKQIGEARKATVNTMEELRRARRDGEIEPVKEHLRAHLEALSRVIHPRFTKGSGVLYACTVGLTLVGVIGLDASWQSLISSKITALPMVAGAHEVWQRRRRRALTSTLFNATVGSSE